MRIIRIVVSMVLVVLLLSSFVFVYPNIYSSTNGFSEAITIVFTEKNTSYYINGEKKSGMEAAPEIKHDRIFLLVRYVADSLPGCSADWDPVRKEAIITYGNKKIILEVNDDIFHDDDDQYAYVNGEKIMIDPENKYVKPYLKEDRTLLPLRFIGEQLGAEIGWNANSKEATLIFYPEWSFEFDVDTDINQIGHSNVYSMKSTASLNGQSLPVNSLTFESTGDSCNTDTTNENTRNPFEIDYLIYDFQIPEGKEIISVIIDKENSRTKTRTLSLEEFLKLFITELPIGPYDDIIPEMNYGLFSTTISKKKKKSILEYFIDCFEKPEQSNPVLNYVLSPSSNTVELSIPCVKRIEYTARGYEIEYYLNIELIIQYKNSDVGVFLATSKLNVGSTANNFGVIPKFPFVEEKNDDSFDMLIITHEKFIGKADDRFNDLADYALWKTENGTKTHVVSTKDIGSPDATLIRDYIRSVYASYDIKYVMLAGDIDTIPCFYKNLELEYKQWCEPFDSLEIIGHKIPTDADYGNLELLKENNCRVNDFKYNIAVGRVPVRTNEDIQIYMNKAKEYQEFDGNRNTILFAGGKLNKDDISTIDGENYKLKMKHGKDLIDRLKEAVPIIESFQKDPPPIISDETWVISDRLYDAISSYSPDIIDLTYHGSTKTIGGADGNTICNTKPSIMFSLACFANNFAVSNITWKTSDKMEHIPLVPDANPGRCFSETILFSECNKCVAFIGNTSFGFYSPWDDGEIGSSNKMRHEFYNYLLKEPVKDTLTIGSAFKSSKNSASTSFISGKWSYYSLNFLGDPSLVYSRPRRTATKISVVPPVIALKPGDKKRFEAKLFDDSGNPAKGHVRWSVVPEDMGYITQDGLFTATTNVDTDGYVYAHCNGMMALSCVHVQTKDSVPKSIKITKSDNSESGCTQLKNKSSICMRPGCSSDFNAIIYDQFGKKYEPENSVRWSIDNMNLLKINPKSIDECNVFSQMKGTSTLTAVYDGLIATMQIEISDDCDE